MPTLEDSKIRFRSVAAIVSSILVVGVATVGFSWNAATTLAAIRTDLKEQGAAIEDVRSKSYTLERACEQALRMAIANPAMRVPDPREPSKLIEVSK